MVVHARNGHICGLLLVGDHVNAAVHSLLDTAPVNGVVIDGLAAIAISIVDQNIPSTSSLVANTIPVVQGAGALLLGRQTTANPLATRSPGFW